MKIKQISPQEAEFTSVLTSIAVMPKILYYIGKIPKKCPCVAIVGARKNTTYGEEVAFRAAYEAAKLGAIVVSGLAYGIDSIAARGALAAGGITVAVLGTPINRIYPSAHEGLARQIIEQSGLILSEIPPDGKFHPKTTFLERNRLISGLADVVLIAEAARRSGSLNTATHALEQGKEVLAVPGDINRELSAGCNRLIRQGAQPYTGPEDLLGLLFPDAYTKHGRRQREQILALAEGETEQKVLSLILDGIRDGDEIIKQTGMLPEQFSGAVTMLEIKGAIKSAGMNQWLVR